MLQHTLAPWAEVAPSDNDAMTVDELMTLPDDGWMYEMVDGRLVRMSPSAGGDSWTAARLLGGLITFVEPRNLGLITGADGEYVLSKPGEPVTSLAPDVAFVRAGRHPAPDSPDFRKAWRLAPDLAVEVASPNQYRPNMAAKALRYLEAGARLLWVVWPKYQQVDVWRPGSDRPVATLSVGDVLDGLDVLPEFTYPVARLFS